MKKLTALLLLALATACSGQQAAPQAQQPLPASDAEVKFARCMRDNGIGDYPDTIGSEGYPIKDAVAFDKAQQTCAKWKEAGGTAKKVDAAPSPPQATAEIVRGDLTDTVSLSGKIIFSGERVVRGQTTGTVTAVAASGRPLRQGQVLYRVDRKPVVLMYGRLPLYRPLRQGVKDGPDVRQLETALRALGHGEDVTVDDRFSWATARAVRAWQK
ncbi:Putative peptidoglycan binding domain-containing protein [Streptosporangium canum]|uniref:Putative peptidoglycan binding domain-containing protein n=1 Tax=Streptosporangium canum TaxID=324952 RepID=A0A1I3RK39_9ACTN|nr:peptidoglycan-binding domain-containing protein [Streptosporangium canum]SFJ46963.1 Putative peptidoglycan binding domain-containing protein [Streptosporangium canum]